MDTALQMNGWYLIKIISIRCLLSGVGGKCIGGFASDLTLAQQYGGVLLDGDPLYGAYLDERISKLQKAINGLQKSAAIESAVKVKELTELCRILKEKRDTL